MSKINHIKIVNFKAISNMEADFNGHTAIIVGGNNKGKSSFLRSIPDRIRFQRPEIIVKNGEESGHGEMVLDSGEKFVWEFDKGGKDKLTYITEKGMKLSCTKEIGERFFTPTFDIDKFLLSTPKKQAEQLQKILGIDFTEIDARYKHAYDTRTDNKRDVEKLNTRLSQMAKVEPVEAIVMADLNARKEQIKNALNAQYIKNKQHNEQLKQEFIKAKIEIDGEVDAFNKEQADNHNVHDTCLTALNILIANGYEGKDGGKFIKGLKDKVKPLKVAADLYPKEPEYINEMPDDKDMVAIDSEIMAAVETNQQVERYKAYVAIQAELEVAKQKVAESETEVKEIETQRKNMIDSAKFPQGLSITDGIITIDGFPLDKNQISTSKLYCAALQIASMGIGEVKTLYFDASPLDNNSLAEIEKWANENDLQLLIEMPDKDGGEIKYEIVENL